MGLLYRRILRSMDCLEKELAAETVGGGTTEVAMQGNVVNEEMMIPS